MIEIDGSIGEGGGQVLRVGLALSALMRIPVMIKNIRVNRLNPGLRPQHLTAVRAVAEITGAKVSGFALGSSKITFAPRHRRGGTFCFDAKTAGSTTLILQALLPVLAFADHRSYITLIGGTNNPLAPQVDYVINVLNPVLATMGFRYELHLVARGFYPQGGGIVKVFVEPIDVLHPLTIINAESPREINGISHSRNLPRHVVERQAEAAKRSCSSAGYQDINIVLDTGQGEESPSTGSGILLWTETSSGGRLAGDALGARGKSAELVGMEAATKLLTQLSKRAPLDVHIGDQLIIWLALAKGASKIKTTELTLHAVTAVMVTEAVTGCQFKTSGEIGKSAVICCSGGMTLG